VLRVAALPPPRRRPASGPPPVGSLAGSLDRPCLARKPGCAPVLGTGRRRVRRWRACRVHPPRQSTPLAGLCVRQPPASLTPCGRPHRFGLGVPIVPVVNVGGHEVYFTVFSSQRLARWSGMSWLTRVKTVPLTLGLPWASGSRGFVPYLPLPA